MNREQFIKQLRQRLMALPIEEREKAIGYYEGYFDRAGNGNEANVINELGDIDKLAAEIIKKANNGNDSLSRNQYVVEGYNENQNIDTYNQNNSVDKNIKFVYSENEEEKNNKANKKKVHINVNGKEKSPAYLGIIIIIGIIIALPIIGGLFGGIMGVFGAIIGFVASILGLIVSTFATLISIPIAGIAAIGTFLYNAGKLLLLSAGFIAVVVIISKFIQKVAQAFSQRND